MKLTTVGDRELWVLKTEAWSIPVYVQFAHDEKGEDLAICNAALSMGRDAVMAVSAALGGITKVRDPGMYVVGSNDLKAIAEKAPGVTPGYYFKKLCDPERAPKELSFEEEPEAPYHNDEFVREIWSKHQFVSLGTFKAVWAALINGMTSRLLIDCKPVDLGWFSIHAVPYRPNWKHNILAKHPNLSSVLKVSPGVRLSTMNISGVTADLSRTDMIATKQSKTRTLFRWSLEVETGDAWEEYVTKLEESRYDSSTKAAYVNRWGTIVRRLRPVIVRLLQQFCRDYQTPTGLLAEDPATGSSYLVQNFSANGGSPVRPDRLHLPDPVNDRPSEVRSSEDPKVKRKKNAKMRGLPILRPNWFNMRGSGGDAVVNRGADQDGMLVLPADGDAASGEELLGGGDGDSGRAGVVGDQP